MCTFLNFTSKHRFHKTKHTVTQLHKSFILILWLHFLIFILSQCLFSNRETWHVSSALRSQEIQAGAKTNFSLKLRLGGGPLKTHYAPHHVLPCAFVSTFQSCFIFRSSFISLIIFRLGLHMDLTSHVWSISKNYCIQSFLLRPHATRGVD